MLPVTSPTLAYRAGVEPAFMVLETMVLPLDYRHIRGVPHASQLCKAWPRVWRAPSSGVRESDPRLQLGKLSH